MESYYTIPHRSVERYVHNVKAMISFVSCEQPSDFGTNFSHPPGPSLRLCDCMPFEAECQESEAEFSPLTLDSTHTITYLDVLLTWFSALAEVCDLI